MPFSRPYGFLGAQVRLGKRAVSASLLRRLSRLRFAHGAMRTTLPPLADNSPLSGGDDGLFSLSYCRTVFLCTSFKCVGPSLQ